MKKIIPFFLLILLLASCQKDPDMSKLDNDFVVYTNHDSKTDFKSFTTFYVPDSVLVIGSSEKPQYWTASEADNIISTVIGNMESRGYTRTMDKEDADLGLQVSFVQTGIMIIITTTGGGVTQVIGHRITGDQDGVRHGDTTGTIGIIRTRWFTAIA